jgi:uncharacterized protein (TIGR02453 family)
MQYFNDEFIKFFKTLEKNNNKEWFDNNRKTYEQEVKKKFELLVSDLILEMQSLEVGIMMKPKDAIFRINRDIRFSNDKRPYKTNVSCLISAGGKKDTVSPGLYLEVSSIDVNIYGGAYLPDKEQLYKIRESIAQNVDDFKKAINDKTFKKYYPDGILGESNKVIPKEFKELANEEPLIANKQFYYISSLGKSFITSDKLKDEVILRYKASKPIREFLKNAIN